MLLARRATLARPLSRGLRVNPVCLKYVYTASRTLVLHCPIMPLAPSHLPLTIFPCSLSRVNVDNSLRKTDGNSVDSWFAKQEREALEKLKASMAKKKKPIDEADEKVRLQKIIEAVGVREQIREELTVKLLLWKHDEDLVIDSK